MRAILIFAAVALLGAAPATADEPCRMVQEVIQYAKMADPTVKVSIHYVVDTPPPAVFFIRPGLDELLIVRFKDGCATYHVQLTREQIETMMDEQK